MRSLPIVWQRFVGAEEGTCVHCAATRHELERAVAVLGHALRPLGVEPRLEIVDVDEASFAASPAESSRIWISGTPMEEWLAETVDGSQDGSEWSGSERRTVPERLILKAALIASSELVDDVTISALAAALVGRTHNAVAVTPLAAAPAR
jgi:hypothetical protein